MESTSTPVRFPGASGAELAAVLQVPPGGAARGHALFAHCFTCTKDIFAARQVATTLADLGIAVLRFDFTGLGESEGEFAATNFTTNVADLVAAAQYLAANHGEPRILIGHSLGGAAVLAAAPQVPSATAVCTIGAPADPAHVEHLFTDRSAEIKAQGEAEVLLAGRPFTIRRQFLEDIAEVALEKRLATLGKALLICHAPDDSYVEIDNARRIYEAAQHPKSFISLDGADHLLTRRADAEYVAGVIAAWASRYVEAPAPPATTAGAGEPDEVEVKEAGGSGLAQLITNGKHELVADEPVSLGGGNAGPTPYGLLLAALGSCTTMTLRLYARRKGIALRQARVRLRHRRVHATDCEACPDGGEQLEVVERVLELDGDLDGATRERLREIADKCPVHRTLSTVVRVETRLADPA